MTQSIVNPYSRFCRRHSQRMEISYKERVKLADYLKKIFDYPNKEIDSTVAQLIAQKYENSYPKHHWRKIRTTN